MTKKYFCSGGNLYSSKQVERCRDNSRSYIFSSHRCFSSFNSFLVWNICAYGQYIHGYKDTVVRNFIRAVDFADEICGVFYIRIEFFYMQLQLVINVFWNLCSMAIDWTVCQGFRLCEFLEIIQIVAILLLLNLISHLQSFHTKGVMILVIDCSIYLYSINLGCFYC